MAGSQKIPPPGERRQSSSSPAPRKQPERKRTGCFGALIYFCLVIGVSIVLAGLIWIAAEDVLSLRKPDVDAAITIEEGDDIGDVAEKLKDAEIINYPFLFRLYGGFSNAEEKIEPGSYVVNATMDYRALVHAMRQSSGYRETVMVTIPEGFTMEQILKRLEENGVNTYETLKEACDTYAFEYSFLEDIPLEPGRLEGYLFPDTYEFYKGEGAVSAISKFLSNFNRKFASDLRKRAEDRGLTIHEVITIASLIEKEAANQDEMPIIASVIFNRLNSNSLKKLQIDAALQYVLPERKEILTNADLAIDSPYNTYMYEGLPPGPISCPSRNAIQSALYPESTGYYYYALTSEGSHKFSKTYDEHRAVINANPEIYGER